MQSEEITAELKCQYCTAVVNTVVLYANEEFRTKSAAQK